MKSIHCTAVSLGVATLSLIGLLGDLVSPTHNEIYHLSGSPTEVFLPVALNFCLLWLLVAALLLYTRRPGWTHRITWTGLILFLPWALLKNCAKLTGWDIPYRLDLIVFATALSLFVLILVGWRNSFQPWFERTQRFMVTLLGFASLCGLLALGQLLWFGWQARALNVPLTLHRQHIPLVSATARPRVIWILLDELSYQQVYERRFPGLQLPAFDRLASESTLFTNVIPAGNITEEVIPSLFTGVQVNRVTASADGRHLVLHHPDTDRPQFFDAHDTIFQDALDAGYSTGVVGWYNPYCRVLSQVLDRCFWTSRFPLAGGMSGDQSFISNLLAPVLRLTSSIPTFLLFRQDMPATDVHDSLHIADYRDLSREADRLLADPSVDYIFLHLPIPHPPGIYDRKLATLTTRNSSYIDNLALADTYIAHVRQILERQGQWDSSAIVVMGDHSWRTRLVWSQSPYWTPEDKAASHGAQFDARPAYIVKLPHQQQAAHIIIPFRATETRALFDAIMANRIRSSADLSAWANEQQ